MKIVQLSFVLIASLFLFTACPSQKIIDPVKKLKTNNYDFNELKRFYHKGIYIFLPSYMSKDYSSNYVNKSDGLALSIAEISLYISVEQYSAAEGEDFQFQYTDTLSILEAVHSNFVWKRLNSLHESKISISTHLPKGSKLNGYFNFVEGKKYSNDEPSIYCISTVEKKINGKLNYFVIQLICPKDLASYLTDDFRKTLKRLK